MRLAQRAVVPLFCLTLFASSALLFLAEPMFAKMVLPLLGGTPAVWNTCMVSFQALLLAAYAYGHWSMKWLGVRRHLLVQVGLLIAIAFLLPIAVPAGWRPPVGRSPIPWLLAVLPVGVGLPFFAVASTAPVLQRWFSATGHRSSGDPYFLYAASNLGSMTALLAYPSLVEPLTRLPDQSRLWSIGYFGLIGLVACCAMFVRPQPATLQLTSLEKITPRRRARWILLSMVPSSLLLGTTTFITTDIAAVPLLWIVPLAIYLLSFILVFASRPILPHRLMVRLQPVMVLGVALFMLGRVAQPVWMVLLLHLSALFVSSMVCHGELAKDRPTVGRLTDFYLTMSLGGVLGGLFNALLAPLIFSSALEYPVALVAACALCPAVSLSLRSQSKRLLDATIPLAVFVLAFGLPRLLASTFKTDAISLQMAGYGVALMVALTARRHRLRFLGALIALFAVVTINANSQVLTIRRSFFGIHRVIRNPNGPFNDLYHGTTVHGRQAIDAAGMPDCSTVAFTYYTSTGPIGSLFAHQLQARKESHVAVVGLGVGSLAAYAGPGTHLTYFEIDPAVQYMAEDSGYFSFLSSARGRGADIRIVLGDARLTLRDLPDHQSDIVVLDAFCGDAIPVHLLTREAMAIYTSKLAAHGVLAIHISNMYLNLQPICSALAADAGCVGLYRDDLNVSPAQIAAGKSASQWVVIGRNPGALKEVARLAGWQPLPPAKSTGVWTDDFANVLSVFRWR